MSQTDRPKTVAYEVPRPAVARITMTRPEKRNAQNTWMTYELNSAFDEANRDPEIKVIILAGEGPHFSAGHDLKDYSGKLGEDFPVVGTWGDFSAKGAEGIMAREQEIFLQMCLRWRDLCKPTIAEVQGKCVAGGLMLAWVCDLIIASDDATFSDPVLQMGGMGVELFSHPWEFGPRKAKEILFLGSEVSAEEARQLGMVNRVLPRASLSDGVLDIACEIAKRPAFSLKLAKMAVNQALEAQGQLSALKQAFQLHQLAHSHSFQLHGRAVDPAGVSDRIRKPPKPREEEK